MVGAEIGPAIEAMLMMRPLLRSIMCAATALQMRKTDLVLTANVLSQSSSVLLVKGRPGVDAMPALFTTMSILPNVSRTRSVMALTSAALVTSVFIASALRPSAFTSAETLSAFITWMSGMAMSAPSCAIASTIPRPIPLPPPVTTATLPANRMQILPLRNRRVRARKSHMTTQALQARNCAASRRLSVHRVFEAAEHVQVSVGEFQAGPAGLADDRGRAERPPCVHLRDPPIGVVAGQADAALQRKRRGIAARLARVGVHASDQGLAARVGREV